MAHKIRVTVTDTSTFETRGLTEEEVIGVDTFDLGYLDGLFDYEDCDDFKIENLTFSDPEGFPAYLDGTDPDDVELLFHLRGVISENEDWERALSLAEDAGDLKEMGESIAHINATLDSSYQPYYLDYVEIMNYVADSFTFTDAFIGLYPDLPTFAHQHLRDSGTSLESVDPDAVTVQDWIETPGFRFTFQWADRPDGVLVFWNR